MNPVKIPYSPLVPLVESHVAIYKIYVLKNPLKDNEIFYVGQTFQLLETRLSGHIAETGANRPKIHYIKEIIDAGSKPIIEAVEVIRGTCYIDKIMVNERELYWIRYHLTIGCKLLNVSGISNGARCHEYHGYLSSLKKGETSWHYYYCGKTAGGYEVYDEEKLKADGFRLPQPPKPLEEKSDKYNPYTYEKFLIKAGLQVEKPKERINITTEIFPQQPAWSKEFAAEIPYNDIFEDNEVCDFDCEPEGDKDDSDYEIDYDEEVEYEESNGFIFEPEFARSQYINSLSVVGLGEGFSLRLAEWKEKQK